MVDQAPSLKDIPIEILNKALYSYQSQLVFIYNVLYAKTNLTMIYSPLWHIWQRCPDSPLKNLCMVVYIVTAATACNNHSFVPVTAAGPVCPA